MSWLVLPLSPSAKSLRCQYVTDGGIVSTWIAQLPEEILEVLAYDRVLGRSTQVRIEASDILGVQPEQRRLER